MTIAAAVQQLPVCQKEFEDSWKVVSRVGNCVLWRAWWLRLCGNGGVLQFGQQQEERKEGRGQAAQWPCTSISFVPARCALAQQCNAMTALPVPWVPPNHTLQRNLIFLHAIHFLDYLSPQVTNIFSLSFEHIYLSCLQISQHELS